MPYFSVNPYIKLWQCLLANPRNFIPALSSFPVLEIWLAKFLQKLTLPCFLFVTGKSLEWSQFSVQENFIQLVSFFLRALKTFFRFSVPLLTLKCTWSKNPPSTTKDNRRLSKQIRFAKNFNCGLNSESQLSCNRWRHNHEPFSNHGQIVFKSYCVNGAQQCLPSAVISTLSPCSIIKGNSRCVFAPQPNGLL